MEYTKTISALPRGTATAGLLRCMGLSRGKRGEAIRLAESLIKTPQVAMLLKSEVSPMNSGAGAAALVSYGFSSDILDAVRGYSILAAISGRLPRVPFSTYFSNEQTGASGTWLTEVGGLRPIPAVALSYAQNSLPPCTSALIAVLSQELLKVSGAAADQVIIRNLAQAIGKFFDQEFLGPTLGPLTGERPGSITYPGLKFTSTGSTSVAILADLNGMLALLTSWIDPVWITTPQIGRKLGQLFGVTGDGPRNIMGVPYVTTTNSPSQLVLVDLARIVLADDGEIDLSVAEHAAIVATSTPGSSPVSSELVSLWQRGLVGFRVQRRINWKLLEAASAVCMTVNY